MIATLMMVIILGALATITAQWLPGWNRGIAVLQRVELVAVGMERLTDDLAAAEYVSAGGDVPLFDGTELSVVFVRTTLNPSGGRGLEILQIAQTSEDGVPMLVRSTAQFVPTIAEVTELTFSNPVVLLRGPYRVLFSYAGTDRVWRDTWRGAAQLPRAIRIRVRDAATLQTLTVSTSTLVHAELSARCVMDLTRLDLVESKLGSNAGAAALRSNCLGPSTSSNPGGITAGADALH